MTYSYVETCKNVISGIDPEELASMSPGGEIGRGSSYAFRSVGKLVLANTTEIHVGIKTPIRDKNAERRLVTDLAFVSFITQYSPELIPNVPLFMSLVCLEDSDDPLAILTEDASQGGKKRVITRSASNEIRAAIYKPFQKLGTYDELVRDEECDQTLAFSIDGEGERLLDFTPLPIIGTIYSMPAYKTAVMAAWDVVPELTIKIPSDSPLGNELK